MSSTNISEINPILVAEFDAEEKQLTAMQEELQHNFDNEMLKVAETRNNLKQKKAKAEFALNAFSSGRHKVIDNKLHVSVHCGCEMFLRPISRLRESIQQLGLTGIVIHLPKDRREGPYTKLDVSNDFRDGTLERCSLAPFIPGFMHCEFDR